MTAVNKSKVNRHLHRTPSTAANEGSVVSSWTKGSETGFPSDADAEGNRFNPNKLPLCRTLERRR